MSLIKDLTSLAQKLDDLGMKKEADTLDRVVAHISEVEESDVEGALLSERVSHLVSSEKMSLESALDVAAEELSSLRSAGEAFEATDDDRKRAEALLPYQTMNMLPIDDSIES